MPTISRFYGMSIKMYFREKEHDPPHIHVIYGEYMGEIEISTGRMLVGDLPRRALRMIDEWLALHRDELARMWDSQRIENLAPLD